MRAAVDASLCMSAGYCAQVSPSVFEVDEAAGHAVVLVEEVPAEADEDTREAETLCPTLAITLTD